MLRRVAVLLEADEHYPLGRSTGRTKRGVLGPLLCEDYRVCGVVLCGFYHLRDFD